MAETGERDFVEGAFYKVRYCGGWTVGRYRRVGDHLGSGRSFHLLGGNGNAWCLVDPEDLQEMGERIAVFPNGYAARRRVFVPEELILDGRAGIDSQTEWGGVRLESLDGGAIPQITDAGLTWADLRDVPLGETALGRGAEFYVYCGGPLQAGTGPCEPAGQGREPNRLRLAKTESAPGVDAAPPVMAAAYPPVWTIEKRAGSSAISGPDDGVALTSDDALPEGVEVEVHGGEVWLDLDKDDDLCHYDMLSPAAARLIAAALVRAADEAEKQAGKASYVGWVRESLGQVASALALSFAEMRADLAAVTPGMQAPGEAGETRPVAEPESGPPPEPDVPAWLAESDHPLYGKGSK